MRDRGRLRRILYVEVNEDGTVGGSHQALYDLVRNLDPSRYEPIVLFYQQNRFADRLRNDGFEVHVCDEERRRELDVQITGGRVAKTMGVLRSILWRRDFLKVHRVDAVHMNNNPRCGHDDWLPACRSLRLPIFSSVMGDPGPVTGVVHRWLYRHYDRYLPISAEMTDKTLANGVDRGRMSQIYLGVDLDTIKARVGVAAADVRRKLSVREGQLLILMAGNIRPWKGQFVLLRALAQLDQNDRSRLRVAFAGALDEGSRKYWEQLRAFEAKQELGEVVLWLGFRDDMPDLYAAADLAVHCSVTPEPFGLVVVEAMALATPVAASDSGGPKEIVTSESGWLYDPAKPSELADILRHALAHPGILADKASGAVERAAFFTVKRNVLDTMAVYDEAFGS
jgi:glycosyltransferase involved in cell wall biosynthesis